MPSMKGDLFVSVPEPALKRAIRKAAYETERPLRRVVREVLIAGLVARGYEVEPELLARERERLSAQTRGGNAHVLGA